MFYAQSTGAVISGRPQFSKQLSHNVHINKGSNITVQDVIIIIKAFIWHKIVSVETILSAYICAHMHACARTHTHTHTHIHRYPHI